MPGGDVLLNEDGDEMLNDDGDVILTSWDAPSPSLGASMAADPGSPILSPNGTPILKPNGAPALMPEPSLMARALSSAPSTLFLPALNTREVQPIGTARPEVVMLTTIDVSALNAALRSVHLPTCQKPTHAHFLFREHVPADLPDTVKDKSLIGACLCCDSIRVVCGPDTERGGWCLRIDSYKRGADVVKSEPLAFLWVGRKDGGDTAAGVYRHVEGLADAPGTLTVEKWGE